MAATLNILTPLPKDEALIMLVHTFYICIYICIWYMHVCMYLVYACVCVVHVHVCRHTGAIVWEHACVGEYGGRDPWLGGLLLPLHLAFWDSLSPNLKFTGWPVTPGSLPLFPTPSSAAFNSFSMGAVDPVTTSCFRGRHFPDRAVSPDTLSFLVESSIAVFTEIIKVS